MNSVAAMKLSPYYKVMNDLMLTHIVVLLMALACSICVCVWGGGVHVHKYNMYNGS